MPSCCFHTTYIHPPEAPLPSVEMFLPSQICQDLAAATPSWHQLLLTTTLYSSGIPTELHLPLALPPPPFPLPPAQPSPPPLPWLTGILAGSVGGVVPSEPSSICSSRGLAVTSSAELDCSKLAPVHNWEPLLRFQVTPLLDLSLLLLVLLAATPLAFAHLFLLVRFLESPPVQLESVTLPLMSSLALPRFLDSPVPSFRLAPACFYLVL